MLTLFTTTKPFRGHITTIQRNAIRSWTLLHPECEVILFGNEEGTAAVAVDLGLHHIPQIPCNEYGTPLVNAMYENAQRLTHHDLVGYVNADIILMQDFIQALKRITQFKQQFLMVGQRWNVEFEELLDFGPHWEGELRTTVSQNGQLHGPTGIDFFIFPKGLCQNMPPFSIGRPRWDNWMIYRARRLGIPVIDVTKVVMAVHQNHGYGHVPQKKGKKWEGPEADRNVALIHPYTYVYTLDGATWLLTKFGIIPAVTPRHLRQRVNAWLSFNYPKLRARLEAFYRWRLLRR
jgi:hypothetical protein